MIRLLAIIRAIVFIPFVVFITLALGIPCIAYLSFRPSLRFGEWIIRTWCRLVLGFFSIKVTVDGLENLTDHGCLFLFNHSSLFDIPSTYVGLPKSHRYGAKIELFGIPVFGRVLRVTGILPIARSKRREVLEIYRKSVERVRQGETFALAPEGTRQEDGKTLGAFKRGPFLFSLAGEIPIQPIVITGADDILPKGDLLPALGRWSWNIHLTVLPEVSTKGVDEEGMAKVQAEVFDKMKTQLEKDLKQRDHTPSVE